MNESPKATVGAIITRLQQQELQILLTKRQIPPFKNHWCIPGGHVDVNETLEDAVRREVQEETGLHFSPEFFECFEEIIPAHKIHNVVHVYTGQSKGTIVRQEDEVQEIRWFHLNEACALPLAFTHNEVLAAYKNMQEASPSKEELIIQYEALRSEVLSRLNMRQNLLTTTVAGAGVFSLFISGMAAAPILLLLYPWFTLCIAIAWSHHDVRVGEIGQYVKTYIEPHFPGLNWETFMLDLYSDKKQTGRNMAELASKGTFIGTEIATILLAIFLQILLTINVNNQNPMVWQSAYYLLFALLLIMDVAIVFLTRSFIRERRKRYAS